MDPLADAIKKFLNIGSSRGNIEPPDPDKTDNSGSDAQPPPTGTTTPEPTPNQQDDPDGDYNGDGTTDAEEKNRAEKRHEDGEITGEEYNRIIFKFFCDSGDKSYCK